jgi:hypothetical protein
VPLPAHVVQPAGDGLGNGPIVMRQLIRPETENRQYRGIRAIGHMVRQPRTEHHLNQGKRVTLLPQVGRAKRRAPERTQDLPHRVLGQLRQVPDRRPIVQIESSNCLAGDKV